MAGKSIAPTMADADVPGGFGGGGAVKQTSYQGFIFRQKASKNYVGSTLAQRWDFAFTYAIQVAWLRRVSRRAGGSRRRHESTKIFS